MRQITLLLTERECQPAAQTAASQLEKASKEKSTEDKEKAKEFDAQTEPAKLIGSWYGGVYMPPARLCALREAASSDCTSVEYQQLSWDVLRKSITGIVNRVNIGNIKNVVPELFAENLIRGRRLFARSIMKAQSASTSFTPVFAAVITDLNTSSEGHSKRNDKVKSDLLSPAGQGTLAKAFYFLLQKHREKTFEEDSIFMDVDEHMSTLGEKAIARLYVSPLSKKPRSLSVDTNSISLAFSRMMGGDMGPGTARAEYIGNASPTHRSRPTSPAGPRGHRPCPISTPSADFFHPRNQPEKLSQSMHDSGRSTYYDRHLHSGITNAHYTHLPDRGFVLAHPSPITPPGLRSFLHMSTPGSPSPTGAFLVENSPQANASVFERFRAVLNKSKLSHRVQYMIEVLMQVRKDKHKDNPILPEGLDLVEEDDQITHQIGLEEELQVQEGLNIFKIDPNYLQNEEKYKAIKAEILGNDNSDGDESGSEESKSEDKAVEAKGGIEDRTQTNSVNLCRIITRLFGHLLTTNVGSWVTLECIKTNDTTRSRIFVKILMQEVLESMGLATLKNTDRRALILGVAFLPSGLALVLVAYVCAADTGARETFSNDTVQVGLWSCTNPDGAFPQAAFEDVYQA
ncbi:hypothetical protein HETIRDRAFT_455340 [Heterobasidion irregulare TC 32-1]|uniref:Uncharacterized protein n=1 Tax=Heterobasidion irregulare (strain TC 32-1) TaxID=747525 RepID=W4JU07_HETIT|nr:uncharacterized protein HETIRDRAFT_455340 [Heterobasidion irregulare TC 32-1]ETW76939.1 hypothetical protein HETIRDRAFT_455340 [Heterobasidion irregulare TC 32-1]